MDDDWHLLRDYAIGQSEEAFHKLVERYAGMVYHAALRQMGNAHQAEEVAQAVFIALAQKAGKISRDTILCGWLFRATRYSALNLLRDEDSRARREREASNMHEFTEPDADSAWEQMMPYLDEALDHLKARDREALMVRFFGGKSHKEVGEVLGVSEATAKKRVSRAIEKLRRLFARRGLALPSVALIAALSAHGVQAAPLGLSSSILSLAAAKSTGSASSLILAKQILKLMAWAKVKAAALVGAGVVIGAAATGALILKTGSAPADAISKLESRTGKRIVWEKRLQIPAQFDPKNVSWPAALDELAVQAGAYWSIDYVVYRSDAELRELVKALEDAASLQDSGWTNISPVPHQAAISIAGGGAVRSGGGGSTPKDSPNSTVAMVVVPNAQTAPTGGQAIIETIHALNRALREDAANAALSPERLIVPTSLAPGISPTRIPQQGNADRAAEIARANHRNWTTLYTVRKAPVDGFGIKLVHNGMDNGLKQSDLPQNSADWIKRTEANQFTLSPEDRAAHQRQVDLLTQKKRSGK